METGPNFQSRPETTRHLNPAIAIRDNLELAKVFNQQISFRYNIFDFVLAPDSDPGLILDCYFATRCDMRSGIIGPYPQMAQNFRDMARSKYLRAFEYELHMPLTINQ